MPKPLTTWLPDVLAEQFDFYCDLEGHCKSDMLRKIVMDWLDGKMKGEDVIVIHDGDRQLGLTKDDFKDILVKAVHGYFSKRD